MWPAEMGILAQETGRNAQLEGPQPPTQRATPPNWTGQKGHFDL